MNWQEVQQKLYGEYNRDDPLWCTCYACGKKVHQGIGTIHIIEEHSEIAKSIKDAIQRSVNINASNL